MAAYNSEKFIGEAIESILGQSFSDFELIIVNDRSTDNTATLLKTYATKDKRIVLIENNKNLGLTKSLNIGLEKAKGKYIARLDTDDIALSQRLEKQYNYLEKHKDIFLLGGGAIKIDDTGRELYRYNQIASPKKIRKKLPKKNCLYHSTILFRNEYCCYREKFYYAQDYDLYLTLLSNNKILQNLNEPLIKNMVNPQAITWLEGAKQKLFAQKAKEFYSQRLKYGKDNYNEFNPSEILLMDAESSSEKLTLQAKINFTFKSQDFREMRLLCKNYFRKYGILNRAALLYLLSLGGKRSVGVLRKIVPK